MSCNNSAVMSSPIIKNFSSLSVESSVSGPSDAQSQDLQTDNRASAKKLSKQHRLTVKNLKAIEKARRRRKNKSGNSSYYDIASATSDASTVSTNFLARTSKNGILEQPNSNRPANFDDLRERLDRARKSPSPTESEFQLSAYKIQTAENEDTMIVETSKLLKDHKRGYRRMYRRQYCDFPRHVGFNNGIHRPCPDMVEGVDRAQYNHVPIPESAVPYAGPNAITLPHFAGEWKEDHWDIKDAMHLDAYHGASMVYARNQACSFLGNPDPAGHAYVQTFATDGNSLHTYAHYSTESDGQVTYHQYPTSSSFLVSSYEDYKTSRRRLRNMQDAAKDASEDLRDKMNEKWLAYGVSGASVADQGELCGK